MNRRAFLASVLAAPVVASLPDIRRPSLFAGPNIARLAAALAPVAHAAGKQAAAMFAMDKAVRIAQVSIDTAAKVSAILGRRGPDAPAGPTERAEALMVARDGQLAAYLIAQEAPPSLPGAQMVEVRDVSRFTRDEVWRDAPLRVAIRRRAGGGEE